MQHNPDALIAHARAVLDPFDELQLPSILPNTSPPTFELRHSTGLQLTKEETDWMISSIETSLRRFYVSSLMGWNRQEKLSDLRHEYQRFLFVLREKRPQKVAFLSFRWDVEEDEPIMYIYELFVEPHARGNRIAIMLMTYAEDFCRKLNVRKLMLTVFCRNEAAMRLYRNRLG